MKAITEEVMVEHKAKTPFLKRLGWLVLIWGASVLALGVAAGLMRLFMNAIGLQTA